MRCSFSPSTTRKMGLSRGLRSRSRPIWRAWRKSSRAKLYGDSRAAGTRSKRCESREWITRGLLFFPPMRRPTIVKWLDSAFGTTRKRRDQRVPEPRTRTARIALSYVPDSAVPIGRVICGSMAPAGLERSGRDELVDGTVSHRRCAAGGDAVDFDCFACRVCAVGDRKYPDLMVPGSRA